MTLQEAYEQKRQENLALKREVRRLEKKLDQAASGLFTVDEKVALIKQINQLTRQLKKAEKDRDRYRNMWESERKRNMNYDFDRMDALEENASLQEMVSQLREENRILLEKVSFLEAHSVPDAAKKIKALSDEVARLSSILNNDGQNSGTPTSKTPLNKSKVIPNSREKTGKKKGGQPGHEQHTLPPFPEKEVTETQLHSMDQCPDCGGKLEEVTRRSKDEYDYEVRVIRRRHIFPEYRCKQCGKTSHPFIPNRLKEKCQYGSSLKAMVLALLDLGFVSVNRIRKLLDGFFSGLIHPCEGFIIGMQKKASRQLQAFAADVKNYLISCNLIYWDDTVIFINKRRGCMRFYGTRSLAYFTAHEHKGRSGIDEDDILAKLTEETCVMHDHVVMNYNDDFVFTNIECNQHLQRDLQKLAEISGHSWPLQLKELISTTIHDRKERISLGESAFDEAYIRHFHDRLDHLLEQGDQEYEEDHSRYYEENERRLLNRIQKYRENYFMWVSDFTLPTTNNLSERSLRFAKVHEKVSGQFESLAYARYFSMIRTYLETCTRNGINEFTALLRLTEENPFTLQEVLANSGS